MNYKLFINKLVVFFNPNKANYWHTITRNTLNAHPEKLERYYLNFESKLNYPEIFDEKGIPLYKTSYEPYFYHPIVICQYALGIYEHLFQQKFNNTTLKKEFLKQANWLIDNYKTKDEGKVWYVNYDIPEYGLIKPWHSALAQGEAVSVLTRGFTLTKNSNYLDLAEDAIKLFDKPVKDGGLLNYFKEYPIFEEYPSKIKTVGVLNGFIFSLFGLYDLILVAKSERATRLFKQGIESLKNLLPYYDTKYWSRYYLFDYPNEYASSFTYMSIVMEQLLSLHYITGERIFYDYHLCWKEYSKNWFNKLRALSKKLTYAKKLDV